MRTILTVVAIAGLSATAVFADAAAGKAVFERACKTCHGADGTPNANVAKMMKVEMRDLKAAEVQSESAADIKKIVEEGKGKMKPIKSVTGPDVDSVVAYVKTMKK